MSELEGNTTTALAIPIDSYRHPLKLKDLESDYVKKAQEELEVDMKLGLKKQAQATAKTILKQDIDELTDSKDYYEVDKSTISKLFGIADLKKRCWGINIKEAVKQTIKGLALPLMFAAFTAVLTTVGLGLMFSAISSGSVTVSILSGILGLGAITTLCYGIYFLTQRTSFEYTFIGVGTDVEPLEDTEVKIPYGAKLKALEAKESGIFEGFAIITPQFKQTNKKFDNPFKPPEFNFALDPAIVGITRDNRMYMICYWDLAKDKEKVIDDIEHFKKFKIS